MDTSCSVCGTPLDEGGGCVTCAAKGEGLGLVLRNAYSQVRELHGLLEEQGLAAEMEKVPGTTPQERHHPRWNLYVPEPELEAARAFLGRDWRGCSTTPVPARRRRAVRRALTSTPAARSPVRPAGTASRSRWPSRTARSAGSRSGRPSLRPVTSAEVDLVSSAVTDGWRTGRRNPPAR